MIDERIERTINTYFINKEKIKEFIKDSEIKMHNMQIHKNISRDYLNGYLCATADIMVRFGIK